MVGVEDEHAAEIREIERARRNPIDFAPLYERYVDAVHGYCARRVTDPELAADLTSQIFTRALTALPRYRPGLTPGTFRSWLFSIAHNLVIDTHRTRKETRSLDADSAPIVQDSSLSPEDHAVISDTRRALIAAMDQLTPGQRQIVELRLAGLTGPEIAGVLGMQLTAVKSGQFRAYARLRELLQGHVYAGDAGEGRFDV
jgi:RNA polymerase sigma-70 factor (ECF subfamily)